jgi:hypothetical protein
MNSRLLNGTGSGPILSLYYFKDLIEEAGDQGVSTGYWDYLKHELKRLEARWMARVESADANSAPAGRHA